MKTTPILLILLLLNAGLTGCNKETDPDIADSFVANYMVTETWIENNKKVSKPAFNMSIEKSSQNNNMVLLNNFSNYGAGITAEATVSGNNLSIPQQILPNLKAVNGSGSLSDITLTFIYTESYNGISLDITAIAIKR